MSDGKREIIARLIEEYDIRSAEDIQNALRDLLGRTIQGMMEGEMETPKKEKQEEDPAYTGFSEWLQNQDAPFQLWTCGSECPSGSQERLRSKDRAEVRSGHLRN